MDKNNISRSKGEQEVINQMRKAPDFGHMSIKWSKYGKIKRITVHHEYDVHIEENEEEK